MNYVSLFQAYTQQRSSDAAHMSWLLQDLGEKKHLLEHVFWSNTVLDSQGGLQLQYGTLPARKKFNVISFDSAETVPEVETAGKFWRLRVTQHRVLNLKQFSDEDAFFSALSPKNRKKLRWLRNTMPKLGCKLIPLETYEDFRLFENLYCSQFPKYSIGCSENQAVWQIYQEFIRQKRSFSFILLSEKNEPLAASLGYFSGSSFNYTHLTRCKGEYDKYSPGYYLTFCVIMRILSEHPSVNYFFMGPGEYDYKRAFLGTAFSIYRYERRVWWNIFARLRMKFRCKKEQKNFSC